MTRTRDTYFAAEPPERIGQAILEKVGPYYQTPLLSGGKNGQGGMGFVQTRAWYYYYGFGANGLHASVVGRGGDVGELALVRVNLFRALITSLASMITGPKFEWEPQAENWTYQDVQAVKMAKIVCEHLWNNEGVSRYLALALEAALVQSEGFVHQEFDPTIGEIYLPGGPGEPPMRTGAIRYENLQTQDVVRDPSKPDWTSADWILCRTWRNRYEEAARWTRDAARRGASPEEIREIRDRCLDAPQMAFSGQSWNQSQPYSNGTGVPWNTDDIEVWRFYHRHGSILPMGRDVRMLGDGYVLSFRDLDIDMFPVARITAGEVLNTPYGYTPAYEILGMQETYDSLQSSLATTLTTLGTPNVAVEAGTRISENALAGGLNRLEVPKGAKYPEALQLADVSPAHMPTMTNLKDSMQFCMGQDQIEVGDRTAGSAIAIQDAQVLRKAGTLQTNYSNAASDTGTISLRLIKHNATMPLKVSMVGGGKAQRTRRLTITGDSLGNVDRVFVKMGSGASQSEAGRQQLALTIAQAKPDDVSAKDLLEIATTGRLEPLTEGIEDETLNALYENEMLAEGTDTDVMVQDEHIEHCKTHKQVLNDPAMRKNPAVVKATMTHMQMHYALYYGIKAMAPAPVPPGVVLPPGVQPPMIEVPPEDPGFRDALIHAVLSDPMYGIRMMTLTGQQPPPPAPPGMPGSIMGPNPAAGGPPVANGTPPPASGDGSATPPPAKGSETASGAGAKAPSLPSNPESGQKWNPTTGGDQTTAARMQ